MASTTLQYIVFSLITAGFVVVHCLKPGNIIYEQDGGGETDEEIPNPILTSRYGENVDIKNYKGYENIIKENEKYANLVGGKSSFSIPKLNNIKNIVRGTKIENYFIFSSTVALIVMIVDDLMKKNINDPIKYFNCLVPLLIMPIAFLILKFLPGWKSVFSDTFGYLLNFGSTKALKQFVNNTMDNNTDSKSKEIIEKIYSDPSIYYSILTPENFNDHLEHLLTDKKLQDIEEASPKSWTYQEINKKEWERIKESAEELGKYVLRQDYIGKYFWYLLFGIYAISISSNIMSGYTPIKTKEEIDTKEDKIQQDNIEDNADESSSTTAPVVASLLNTG